MKKVFFVLLPLIVALMSVMVVVGGLAGTANAQGSDPTDPEQVLNPWVEIDEVNGRTFTATLYVDVHQNVSNPDSTRFVVGAELLHTENISSIVEASPLWGLFLNRRITADMWWFAHQPPQEVVFTGLIADEPGEVLALTFNGEYYLAAEDKWVPFSFYRPLCWTVLPDGSSAACPPEVQLDGPTVATVGDVVTYTVAATGQPTPTVELVFGDEVIGCSEGSLTTAVTLTEIGTFKVIGRARNGFNTEKILVVEVLPRFVYLPVVIR